VRPTLFLLPGLLCDEEVWRHQQTALEGRFQIIIPDFRQFRSLGAMAERVLAKAPERFSLAGHSMGGRVALEVVRRAAERLERLALLDTAYHAYDPREREKRQELIDIGHGSGMAAVAASWLPGMLHPSHTSLMEPLTGMVMRSTPDTFENQQTALMTRDGAADVLPRIKCPTLILVGREDLQCPVKQHEEMAAAIPHSKLVVIEECGHMSTVERPEQVTAALELWCQ
jgi:pimeloyl-ACP methyl ester carboxylesterase